MKNQYYGDVNDYLKYGILRAVAGTGLKICVSWMLTKDDESKDGGRTEYLEQQRRWADCRLRDPALFDSLKTKDRNEVR